MLYSHSRLVPHSHTQQHACCLSDSHLAADNGSQLHSQCQGWLWKHSAPVCLTLSPPPTPVPPLLHVVCRRCQVDVYSFGVTVWEMVSRRRPREGLDGMQICALWIASPESMQLPPIPVPDDAGGGM
jgi:hypothetical protein